MISELDRDPSKDLADWLAAVGRRTWQPSRLGGTNETEGAAESSEELIEYLEELAGRKLRSRADIQGYVSELSAHDQLAGRLQRRGQLVKDTVLLLCLLTAYIQYNFLDVNLQIARLPSTVIFVPVDAGGPAQRNSTHA